MNHRCTICGSKQEQLGYASTLDGLVCKQCKKMYFTDAGCGVKAILYDKEKLTNALHNLGDTGYSLVIQALKDIQNKYCYFIDGCYIQPESVMIYLKVQFRGKSTRGCIV